MSNGDSHREPLRDLRGGPSSTLHPGCHLPGLGDSASAAEFASARRAHNDGDHSLRMRPELLSVLRESQIDRRVFSFSKPQEQEMRNQSQRLRPHHGPHMHTPWPRTPGPAGPAFRALAVSAAPGGKVNMHCDSAEKRGLRRLGPGSI